MSSNRILPRLINLIILVVGLFYCGALAFMAFTTRNSFQGLSTDIYGKDAPLMDSYFLEVLATPAAGAVFGLIFLLLLAKEFYIASIQRRLIVNAGAFVALAAVTVVAVYLFSAPAMAEHSADKPTASEPSVLASDSQARARAAAKGAAAQLARGRVARAIVALENTMATCKDKRRTLSVADLDGVNVPRAHLRTALVYFHVRNENACIEDEAKEFLLATYLLDEAGILKDMGETTQPELASFIMRSYWQEVEHEARYRTLPEAVREQLEAVEALQGPFKLIESGKALGLLQGASARMYPRGPNRHPLARRHSTAIPLTRLR